MDDVPCGTRKDFKGAVAILFTNDPVPKKRKENRSVAEISATTAKENKTGGCNLPRKQNWKQGGKKGEKLKSYF